MLHAECFRAIWHRASDIPPDAIDSSGDFQLLDTSLLLTAVLSLSDQRISEFLSLKYSSESNALHTEGTL